MLQLFDRYMMSPELMRISSLGPNGFAAFDAAFRATNLRENKLRGAQSVVVLDGDLHGIDALWTLSVEVGARAVGGGGWVSVRPAACVCHR